MLLFNILGTIPKNRNYYYKEITVWSGSLVKSSLTQEKGIKGPEKLFGKIYGYQQKLMFQLEGNDI